MVFNLLIGSSASPSPPSLVKPTMPVTLTVALAGPRGRGNTQEASEEDTLSPVWKAPQS